MSSLIRSMVLAVSLVICWAPCTLSGQEWARKIFKSTSHDFRAVARGAKVEHHFEFENLYQEDVHVSAVRSSCGCTTPSVTQTTLKSREKSAIVATFNTSSFTGQKAATITVVFDRPFFAEVQLTVAGFIRTDVIFDPPEADFGEIREGEAKEIQLSVTRLNRTDWRITDVRSHCADLQVKLSEPVRMTNAIKYNLTLKLKDTMPAGELREQLTLVTNDQQSPTVEMCVGGTIRPSLSVSPASVSMGAVRAGESYERRLIVRAETPFAIAKVVCADPRFSFEKPAGKKKIHFLPLRFEADDKATPVAQKVRIVSDLPNDHFTELLVTGSVTPATAASIPR